MEVTLVICLWNDFCCLLFSQILYQRVNYQIQPGDGNGAMNSQHFGPAAPAGKDIFPVICCLFSNIYVCRSVFLLYIISCFQPNQQYVSQESMSMLLSCRPSVPTTTTLLKPVASSQRPLVPFVRPLLPAASRQPPELSSCYPLLPLEPSTRLRPSSDFWSPLLGHHLPPISRAWQLVSAAAPLGQCSAAPSHRFVEPFTLYRSSAPHRSSCCNGEELQLKKSQ